MTFIHHIVLMTYTLNLLKLSTCAQTIKVIFNNRKIYYVNSEITNYKLKIILNLRLRIRPKCLIDVSSMDITTTVLGAKISMPIGIAPTAMQRMAHPDGEVATAKGNDLYGDNRLEIKISVIYF